MIVNKRVNTNVYLLQFVATLKGKVCQPCIVYLTVFSVAVLSCDVMLFDD